MSPSARKFPLQHGDLLLIVVVLLIAYLTIVPLVMLVYGSLKSSPRGLPGHFTLTNYAEYLPYGMRACSSSMHQIQKELEEASEMSGASRPYTFARVLLPLLLPGFVAGWIYVITHSFRELSALGMTLVVVLVAISLVARWVGGKFSVQQA